MVFVELVLLIIFIFILAKSAAVVVENASVLAQFFKVSNIAIGVLLVAFSTSLPELAVAISSAIGGNGAISAGNVFGSNIANILVVFGIGAVLYSVIIPRKSLQYVIGILFLTTIISVYIIMNSLIFNRALGFLEGLLLLAIFFIYAAKFLKGSKVPENGVNHGSSDVTRKEAFYAFAYFGIGIIAVLVSSEVVVSNAISVASELGIAESLLGATMIAIGTSLPELTINLQAFRSKKYDLAIGDALGSNVINLTVVLGTGALLNEIQINLSVFIAALLFAIVANMILLYFAVVGKKMQRNAGILFLFTYVLFLAVIIGLQATVLGKIG